jgi:hypothetical protein
LQQQQQQQQHQPYQFSEHYSEHGFGAPFMSEFYHRSGILTDDLHDRGNSESFLDHDLSDDMPFAVDPIMCTSMAPHIGGAASSGIASNQNATLGTGLASMMNDASLMASMCVVTPKRLAMFDSQLHGGDEVSKRVSLANSGSSGDAMVAATDVMDSLADQLADFKSFGASLSIASASRISSGNSSFAPEAPTASAGSG